MMNGPIETITGGVCPIFLSYIKSNKTAEKHKETAYQHLLRFFSSSMFGWTEKFSRQKNAKSHPLFIPSKLTQNYNNNDNK